MKIFERQKHEILAIFHLYGFLMTEKRQTVIISILECVYPFITFWLECVATTPFNV
jgi:hypothetical protein